MNKTAKSPVQKPVVLCILDGWGERDESLNNAIKTGHTPHWDRMVETGPKAQLIASGLNVGLPDGQMGNSEVGHMTIGSGRVILQDLPRIDSAIHDGSLDNNPVLLDFIEKLKASGGVCHLMGLLSDGGVHSHQWHMRTLAAIICSHGLEVKVHAFLDGRDTPPKSAASLLKRFVSEIRYMKGVSIATVIGRYWAMDRDKRWDRVKKAYDCMVDGVGVRAQNAVSAVKAAYEGGKTDEFVEPTLIGEYAGMKDGDGILMANFRADRAREILTALADPKFDGFKRSRVIVFAARAGMVEYSDQLKSYFPAIFGPVEITDLLSEVISKAGLTQLHTAETEKYAHVTFFFNGGREEPFSGEERIMVRSPNVATYDLQPQMSAPEVTDKLVAAIESGKFDFIVVNYANGDMVGHTGILEAAVKAVEAVDVCLGRLEKAVRDAGGVMIVTADHGNCEKMLDGAQPHTAHTLYPVPAVLVNAPAWARGLHNGGLADLAPTLLHLLGLDAPKAMTGHSLIDTDGTSGEKTISIAE
jgi:2,3-bisphosphoglycerate-independent phosphoglycerate mutase